MYVKWKQNQLKQNFLLSKITFRGKKHNAILLDHSSHRDNLAVVQFMPVNKSLVYKMCITMYNLTTSVFIFLHIGHIFCSDILQIFLVNFAAEK